MEEEHRVREESALSEKAAFEDALEEEKGLRGATETKIQALERELKIARGELSRTKADLNGARARIRSAVADYKNSLAFDNHVELRRQQWLSDFQQNEGYRNEIKFATLDEANRVLDKLSPSTPSGTSSKRSGVSFPVASSSRLRRHHLSYRVILIFIYFFFIRGPQFGRPPLVIFFRINKT